MRAFLIVFVCVGLVIGCATTPNGRPDPEAELDGAVEGPPQPRSDLPDRVTLSMNDTTLGAVIRRTAEVAGGQYALMNGLESMPIERAQFNNARFGTVAQELVEGKNVAIQECPSYYFFFLPDYEVLTNVSIAGNVAPMFQMPVEQLAFASNMPLYTVLSWLSQGVGMTVVADNAVAHARCGEIALRDIPLDEAVEAIVKSALIPVVQVDSTDEYVFLQAPSNPSPRSALLNDGDLSQRQREFLDRKVSVILPNPPSGENQIEAANAASPLGDVLISLSEQLGIRVVAESGLESLPVNPAAFIDVRVETAMDLLIRQWLVPEFGYQITRDRIVIRRRTGSERL